MNYLNNNLVVVFIPSKDGILFLNKNLNELKLIQMN